jgi:hypothetical protein
MRLVGGGKGNGGGVLGVAGMERRAGAGRWDVRVVISKERISLSVFLRRA